jgi:hypothetical protein
MRALVKHLRRVGATAVVIAHDDAGSSADDAVNVTVTAAR